MQTLIVRLLVTSWMLLILNSQTMAELTVTSLIPRPNQLAFPVSAPIRIDFDRPVDASSVNEVTLSTFGRWSGSASGSFEFMNGDRSILFRPTNPFSAGELVTVTMSNQLLAADGTSLRPAGYSTQFWTASQRVSNLNFNHTSTLVTGSPSRPYGGVATDLNHDGWLDVTLVNEDSADLRVFINQADGTGTFAPYAQPTYAVGNRASPNEVADFNMDGHPDIAVANIDANTVSILLGNGQGGFGPQQVIPVGSTPRGLAVLDVNGDGFADIVNSNRGSNNLSLHINDGSGMFGTPTIINPTLNGEWSLMAGDMDNDGLMDLVVASGTAPQIQVLTGNGDGTFNPQPVHNSGGRSWMIALGDLNGDGYLDVTSANAMNNNGSVLFGNGNGTFQPPVVYNLAVMGSGSNGFPLASDIGDLNGDGALDWVTASYQGNFLVLLNDGNGGFQFFAELPAPAAASCALLFDMDNDGALDLGLIDELANLMTLNRNDGAHVAAGDFDADGLLGLTDIDLLVAAIAAGDGRLVFDLTQDGFVDLADLDAWRELGGAANLPSANAYLLGDANLDGIVDAKDFLIWNANKFTSFAAWSLGDFNADGMIDGQDFLAWNRHKFTAADQPAIPEPVWCCSLGMWALFHLHRRRSRR